MNAILIFLIPISHAKTTLSLKFSVSLLLTTGLDLLSCLKAQFSSVQSLGHDSLQPHGLEQARLSCPSPTPRACSNSCPLSWWCHPTISSSIVPFSSCLQSFLTSGSFPMSQFLASGGQSVKSFSFSNSPSNEYSGLVSFRIDRYDLLAIQGTLEAFTNTTVQKHQFFGAQPSLWFNSHVRTWLLEKR